MSGSSASSRAHSPIATTRESTTKSRKRKRGNKASVTSVPAIGKSEEIGAQNTAPARAKSKKVKTEKNGSYDDLVDVELGINRAIAHMEPQLLVDHIAHKTRRQEKDLSELELEARLLPVDSIRGDVEFEKDRMKENLVEFLGACIGKKGREAEIELKKASKDKGQPHTLVVAGGGLRAAELVRSVRSLQTKDATIAKLFAKHIKLSESIGFCKSHRINMGIGTPQRIADLLEDGALSDNSLRRVIVDASHVDVKKRGILDMRETLAPLIQLLLRDAWRPRYRNIGEQEGKERIELIFF